MREIVIKIGECKLAIVGEYFPEEEETGLPASFEIESIEPLQKNILDLLEWATSLNGKRDYLKAIEELVLEAITRNG